MEITEPQSLKIVKLCTSNFMCLKAGFEIIPKGPVTVLTGKNGSGKSAALNAISVALLGKTALPEKPIRTGASKAEGVLDLGDIIISWTCTETSGFSLTAKDKSGVTIKSPRVLLDTLWNAMLDPQKFVRLSETPDGRRKQAEILRSLVGLDFTKLDTEKQTAFDARRDVNRDMVAAQANLFAREYVPSAPLEEISASALLVELDGLVKANADVVARQHDLVASKALVESQIDELKKLDADILAVEEQLKDMRNRRFESEQSIVAAAKEATADEEAVSKLKLQDENPIRTRIAESDKVNASVRSNREHKKLSDEVEKLKEKANDLTKTIELCEEAKNSQLSKAKFPLPGLTFSDSGLMLDGVPFEQGSQAQQSKAAVAIGMKLKPRIAVVLIREASLYDKSTKLEIVEMANLNGFQVIEEVVDSDDPAAITIEAGEVKS